MPSLRLHPRLAAVLPALWLCAAAPARGVVTNPQSAASLEVIAGSDFLRVRDSAVRFDSTLASPDGVYSAAGHATTTEGATGVRFVANGSVTVTNGVGYGQAVSEMGLSYCAEGGEPYSVSVTLRAPPSASLNVAAGYRYELLGSGPSSGPGVNHGQPLFVTPGQGDLVLSKQGVLGAGCGVIFISAIYSGSEIPVPAAAEYEIDLTLGEGATLVGACCLEQGASCTEQSAASCQGTGGEYQGDGSSCDACEPPPDDECEGDVLTWLGGRGGAFADPESWEPPQVPLFEEGGRCDTAVVQGGRNVTIDLAAAAAPAARLSEPPAALDPRGGVVRKVGRLVVLQSKRLRTTGGRVQADARSPVLGKRSLEIGGNASLLLQDEVLVTRHAAIGTSGAGEVDVAGDNGFFETGGRLGLGADGEGRLVVRDGATASCAEVVIGEVSAEGSVLVEGTRSLLSTGKLTVGLAHDGLLEVLSGARVESEAGHVDSGLEGGELALAKVRGKDAQGNRATWTLESLTIGLRGKLDVEAGGLVEVVDELLVPSTSGSVQGFSVNLSGQLSAGSVTIETGAVLVSGVDALLFVPQVIRVGSDSSPASLDVVGPASAPQIDATDLLSVEGLGKVQLTNGARVNLLGPFNVGTTTLGKARLEVVAGDTGTGAPSLLRANEAGDFQSFVGSENPTAGGVSVAPTGELRLGGGRVELAGLNHSLFVQRLGLLRGRDGQLSIQAPGALVNDGVVDGDLVLEGDYEQGPEGTRRASILFASAPAAGGRVLDPLAAARFPRRALRAKPALPAFGPLVVTGSATLDGRVELQFGNGVAPRLGEAFDVLEVAGTVTGSFAEVAIRGLVPGSFAFEPSLVGGKLTLTSLTDAAALPAVSVKAKARLKETAKRGGKIKLKRTGDTSAPLVVTYTVGGTAQSGIDYEALPGTIEIPAKKKSATIVVKPIADGLLEGPETIEFELAPNETFAPGAVSSAAIELLSKDE